MAVQRIGQAKLAGAASFDWFRSEFPVTQTYCYLDHAAIAPMPSSVRDALDSFSAIHLNSIHEFSQMSDSTTASARKLAARLVGSGEDRIAFIQNTSHGVSLIANGLTFRPGDNVIVPDLEFPSNYLVWLKIARECGIELRHLRTRYGSLDVADLAALVDDRTRVVTLSQVQYHSGYKAKLEDFGEVCRKRNIHLIVDGTQSTGALRIDMNSMGVDAVVVSSHKWMMGPLGIGFMALSDRLFNALKVDVIGWLSVNEPFAFRRQLDLLPDARRFEPGTANTAGIFGLLARLEQLDALGSEATEQRVLELSGYTVDCARRTGFEVGSPRSDCNRSGIVTIRDPSRDMETLNERLRAAGVIVSVRNMSLRVSPHYYNNHQDIDRLFHCVQS